MTYDIRKNQKLSKVRANAKSDAKFSFQSNHTEESRSRRSRERRFRRGGYNNSIRWSS